MRKTILLAASALSTLAAVSAAHAQAPASTQVEALQVTARNLEDTLPEQLAAAGSKVETVSGQAIRAGGYSDLSTALQSLAPGLHVLPYNGPFDDVDLSLLGSRPEDVLFLVDGVRLNNRLYTNVTPLSTVPAGVVDHVELVDGGQSLFYGTAAAAGAVNIVTRPFTAELGGSLQLSADTGSNRHIDANLSDGTRFGQFVVYGSADKSDGFQAFPDQDYQRSAARRKRGYSVYTGGAKYQVDLTQQLQLGGSYQRTEAHFLEAWPYRYDERNQRTEDLATARVNYQATERLGVLVKGYWHNWRNSYDATVNLPALPGVQVVGYDGAFRGYWDYGVNALGKFDVARGVETYFGYDMQRYGGRDDLRTIRQTDEEVHAGFGQLRLTPELIPHATLAAGFRYNAPSIGPSNTIWNVSGRYELPSGLYLRGQVGTNFRLPSAEELFSNDSRAVAQPIRGNPDLKPERTFGGDVSLGLRLTPAGHLVRLEATGFARDTQDRIDLGGYLPSTGQYLVANVAGTVRTRGGQFDASAAVNVALGATLAYTYSDTTDAKGVRYLAVPEHLFKAGLDWHPADLPLGASANVVYTGDATAPVGTATVHYGDYAVWDVSGRYYIDAGRRHVINLSIRNFFDRDYGRPFRGCTDVLRDAALGCSRPYAYTSLGMPRTFAVAYRYSF